MDSISCVRNQSRLKLILWSQTFMFDRQTAFVAQKNNSWLWMAEALRLLRVWNAKWMAQVLKQEIKMKGARTISGKMNSPTIMIRNFMSAKFDSWKRFSWQERLWSNSLDRSALKKLLVRHSITQRATLYHISILVWRPCVPVCLRS